MNFDVGFMLQLLPNMLKYAGVTLHLSVLAIVCGLVLAFIIAVTVHAQVPLLTGCFKLYVSFFRGTPLMAQLFCFYFGVLPLIGSMVHRISSFSAALIVLSLASSAYMSESLRAAFSSIEKGQMEAAYSVGMTYMQAMRCIILPQAVRVALPTLFSSFINIIKDTSLVFAIGVKEMMAQAQLEGSSGYRYLEAYICVLFVYWVITASFGKMQKKLEKKFSREVGLDG